MADTVSHTRKQVLGDRSQADTQRPPSYQDEKDGTQAPSTADVGNPLNVTVPTHND